MFADTSAFLSLLLFSLIVGAMLGLFYDLLKCIIAAFFESEIPKKDPPAILGGDERALCSALFPYERKILPKDIVRFFTDIIFWAVAAFSVTVLIFHLNYGKIRAFSLISAIVGFTVWEISVGRPISFLLCAILKMLRRSLCTVSLFFLRGTRTVLKILLLPLMKPIAWVFLKLTARIKKRITVRKALSVLRAMELNEAKNHNHKKDRKNEKDQSRSA